MRKFGYVVLVCGVILLLCELLIRFTVQIQPGLDRIPHPYIVMGGFHKGGYFDDSMDPAEAPARYGYKKTGFFGTPSFAFGTEVNSITERGLFLHRDRADDVKIPKPANTFRVMIQGGSVAYGEGSSQKEKRWFNVMENLLNKDAITKYQVIPAANHSHVTTQERIIQDLYVLPHHPDAIIFLDGFNDANTGVSATRPGDPYGQSIIYLRDSSPIFGFLSDLSKHSNFIRYWMMLDVQTSWYKQKITEEKLQQQAKSVANIYFENLNWMKRRCDLEKIHCLFYLQPYWDLTLSYRLEKNIYKDDMFFRNYKNILERMKTEAPFLVDLTHIFDDPQKPVPFIDPAHFNDAGHEVVAEKIAKDIQKLKMKH